MKRMAAAACAAITFASAWADAGFSAGRWNITFFDDGERLVMSHADGFAEIAGTLSFTGPAKVTGAGIGEGVSLLVYHRTAFAPCAHRLAKLEHILRPGRLEGES